LGQKTTLAVGDLPAVNDPSVGLINGPTDVELAVDPYFPATIVTVDANLKDRTIHVVGRCCVFQDGHEQFIKEARTPSQSSLALKKYGAGFSSLFPRSRLAPCCSPAPP